MTLCGVIDFGEFQGGEPILDFANLHMTCPEVDLAWLQGGYGDKALFDDTFSTRLVLTEIGLQMGYLAHYVRQGNQEEAVPAARGLRRALRKWQRLQ